MWLHAKWAELQYMKSFETHSMVTNIVENISKYSRYLQVCYLIIYYIILTHF